MPMLSGRELTAVVEAERDPLSVCEVHPLAVPGHPELAGAAGVGGRGRGGCRRRTRPLRLPTGGEVRAGSRCSDTDQTERYRPGTVQLLYTGLDLHHRRATAQRQYSTEWSGVSGTDSFTP